MTLEDLPRVPVDWTLLSVGTDGRSLLVTCWPTISLGGDMLLSVRETETEIWISVELRDVTVGIVGLGSIGRAVGALATAFGCRVVAIRRRVEQGSGSLAAGAAPGGDADASAEGPSFGEVMLERVGGPETLPQLLAESDFVVLAAPLTPETEDMIDAEALAAMKPSAWLINVARGRLIDERALLNALRDGQIGGAILDTFRDEPLPPSSPFYDLSNVIVTPHTSWSSGRVLDRSVELFCDNLRRYAAGEPLLNVVDPTAGY